MKGVYTAKISRRTTLQWLAAATSLSGFSIPAFAFTRAFEGTPRGYGSDPDLLNPVVPWSRSMTAQQLQLAAVLSDLILPGSAEAPSPSALGIPDFIDEWVSAPYPVQQADRKTILDGLIWIDAEARRLWGKDFLSIDEPQRRRILDVIGAGPYTDKPNAQQDFFQRLRFLIVGSYYTTKEGFAAIGYIGNVPLASFPGPSDREKALLDGELKKLGIT